MLLEIMAVGPWYICEFLKLLWIFREIWHIFKTRPWNTHFLPWIRLVRTNYPNGSVLEQVEKKSKRL